MAKRRIPRPVDLQQDDALWWACLEDAPRGRRAAPARLIFDAAEVRKLASLMLSIAGGLDLSAAYRLVALLLVSTHPVVLLVMLANAANRKAVA